MSDVVKIYQLYMENAAQNKQPKMTVDKDGSKFWHLHGKLHRIDGAAVEWANGAKRWYQHGKLHRDDGPAVEGPDGDKEWYQHDKLHREDGPAIENEHVGKMWYLHNTYYENIDAWAKAVLKMRNEPHDDEAVQKFVRMILTKDDLI
jgi:hypothetical protein